MRAESLHGEYGYTLKRIRWLESYRGGLCQSEKTLRATLNYAGVSARRRYRRKSGHRSTMLREDERRRTRRSRRSGTYKCVLNINPFERAETTSFACPFEPLKEGIFPTDATCRKYENLLSRAEKCTIHVFTGCKIPPFFFFYLFLQKSERARNSAARRQ